MQLDTLFNLLDQKRHDDALKVIAALYGLNLRVFLVLTLLELRLPCGDVNFIFFRGLNLVMALAVVLEGFTWSLQLEPLQRGTVLSL